MSLDEINIAIAEHLGWTFSLEKEDGIWENYALRSPDGRCRSQHGLGPENLRTPESISEAGRYPAYMLPNYHGDLNAMREADGTLSGVALVKYEMHLASITQLRGRSHAIRATAAQRAEAFLRTVGKWKGEA